MTPYRTIDVKPLSGALGAEIEGVDIASRLNEEQFAEIHRAFADFSVILFRNQSLTQEQHIAFARRWGDINVNRFFTSVAENPIIAEVRKEPDQETNIGRNWHTDHSYDTIPHSARFSTHGKFPSLVAIRCLPVCTERTKPFRRGCGRRLKA